MYHLTDFADEEGAVPFQHRVWSWWWAVCHCWCF